MLELEPNKSYLLRFIEKVICCMLTTLSISLFLEFNKADFNLKFAIHKISWSSVQCITIKFACKKCIKRYYTSHMFSYTKWTHWWESVIMIIAEHVTDRCHKQSLNDATCDMLANMRPSSLMNHLVHCYQPNYIMHTCWSMRWCYEWWWKGYVVEQYIA